MAYSPQVLNLINERLRELPEEIINLIRSSDVRNFTTELKRQLGCSDENIAAVENEIILVLLAFEPPDTLGDNIRSNSSLGEAEVSEIIKKTQAELLAAVNPLLIAIYDSFKAAENSDSAGEGNLFQDRTEEDEMEQESVKERLELRPEGVTTFANEEKDEEHVEKEKQDDDEAKPLTEEELRSSLSMSRTMAKDIAHAKGEAPPEVKKEEPNLEKNIPRYAKPLTDLPNYNEPKKDR